jgi:hypothetical protein
MHDGRGGQVAFPGVQADHALPCLFANAVRDAVAAGTLAPDPVVDTVPISDNVFAVLCSGLRRTHREAWPVSLASLEVPELVARTIGLLREWDFVRGPDAQGVWHIQPTLARHAGVYRADGVGLGSDLDALLDGVEALTSALNAGTA